VDHFSIQWTGFIQPRFSGSYTFYAKYVFPFLNSSTYLLIYLFSSDDGARLYVNGVLVINAWMDKSISEATGSINLVQGQKYSISYQYFEDSYNAEVHLSWSSVCEAKAVVPKSQLYSS